MTDTPKVETPLTDALIQSGPFTGPAQWVEAWDKAIDSHRSLERQLAAAHTRLAEHEKRDRENAIILAMGGNQTEAMYRRAESAESRLREAEARTVERCARVCDGLSDRHFNLIPTEFTENAKHRRGAKAAALMECAAAIRALSTNDAPQTPAYTGNVAVGEPAGASPYKEAKCCCCAGFYTETGYCPVHGNDKEAK